MAETARRAPAHRSLRSRLLVRVLLPLAATWSIGSAIAFSRALLDDAYVIAASVVERDGVLHLALTPHEVGTVLFDREDKEVFAVVDASGRVVASNVDLAALGGARSTLLA